MIRFFIDNPRSCDYNRSMENGKLLLYRKRVIPDECILLKDDVIVRLDQEVLVTSWQALHPKPEFSHGCSCYYLDRGYKVSRIYRPDGSLLHWYCDIVEYSWQPGGESLVVLDLLSDVVIKPDGSIRVLDLDELAQAYEKDLISKSQLLTSLNNLNSLLSELYAHGINDLDEPLRGIVRQ